MTRQHSPHTALPSRVDGQRPEDPLMDTQEQTKTAPIVEGPPESAPLATRSQVMPREEPAAARTQQAERVIVRHSEQVDQLFAAMAAAQAEEGFGDIEKTKTARVESRRDGARSYSYTYETLKDVLNATRPFLGKHGVSFMQFPFPGRESLTIRTLLGHSSGQWLYNDLSAAMSGLDPQAVGSGISYLRRYAAKSILGIAADDEDDDGKAASGPAATPVPDAPAGYAVWLDDLRSVADEGTERLAAAWASSRNEFRSYLIRTPAAWSAIKDKAAAKATKGKAS